MKLDMHTRALYTDQGRLLKILHCPLQKRWKDLTPAGAAPHRSCNYCERQVLDTTALSDEQLADLLLLDPGTCLKVSTDQPNVQLITREHD